ncbi:MAG: C39 family peptidase [Lachnospiraceae bacterium]|nr:C39 family peptidase [Lachnospiraceae bacterium]
MRRKRKIIFAAALIFLTVIICGSVFFIKHKKKKKEEPAKASFEVNGLTFDFSIESFARINSETGEVTIPTVEFPENPDKVELTLELIYQNPEYPAGCEAIALTMLLNYYGYNLDKSTIINDYLIYSEENYIQGYKGKPDISPGGGCYAPAITNTTNRFLIEKKSNYIAKNISGTELTDLFPYIAQGYPVLVWTTVGLNPCRKASYIYKYGDTEYTWVYNEHCVVLTGYDLNENTVTVYDSIDGIITHDTTDFQTIYNDMWKMCVVLEPR